MDPTEDLSARVLLNNILSIESPKTPITSSVSRRVATSGTRQSARLRNKNADPQTPQDIVRRSMKHRIRESITRKSLPATRRRTASVVLKKTNTPAPSSMMFDEADTPRHILMNILQTEPVHSPVVHEEGTCEQPVPSSAKSNVSQMHSSIELSGLDLPDVTIGNIQSTAKGLSRKRPRRSLNVTAFEKRLKDGNDAEEVTEESIDNPSLLSLSSSSSLSLKTPFVGGQTERRGLQRRVSNRRKITVEEFGAAVKKLQMGAASKAAAVQWDLGDTALSEGFTLGLSKLSEPDITTDIMNCNTALYDQPNALTSNLSIVATQDKPTVMASQLQRQMEQSNLGKNTDVFPSEEENGDEVQSDKFGSESQSLEDVDGDPAVVLKSEEEDVAESQTSATDDVAESEEEAKKVEAQTEQEGSSDSHPEEDVEAASDSEEAEVAQDFQTEVQVEEEENAAETQTEDESAADSQPEEDVEAGSSQAGEDEDAPESQSDKEEEEEEREEEEEEEEDGEAEFQTEEGGALSQFEGDAEVESQSDRVEDEAESQSNGDDDGKQEEEEQTSQQLKGALEHISRRAYRSEGALFVPVRKAGEGLANNTVAGWSDAKLKAHSTLDLHSGLEMSGNEGSGPHAGEPDFTDPSPEGQTENEPDDANKENSFRLGEVEQDTEGSRHPRDASPEQPPAEEASEEEEDDEDDEEDDEEREEFPCKTPAFVREKRNFLQPEPSASPSVFKNIQASDSRTSKALTPAKPKQVRQRKKGPAKKTAGLPKSYLMGVFKHFAKTKVSADVFPVLSETMDKFLDRMVEDLETYAAHAKRKTIEVEDCILLLKRQGYVNDKVPVEVLIEKYLSMQQRKLLIPIATSGNVVIPKMRR